MILPPIATAVSRPPDDAVSAVSVLRASVGGGSSKTSSPGGPVGFSCGEVGAVVVTASSGDTIGAVEGASLGPSDGVGGVGTMVLLIMVGDAELVGGKVSSGATVDGAAVVVRSNAVLVGEGVS